MNALYVTLLVAVLLSENVLSFTVGVRDQNSLYRLAMGGGRSPAEQGVTKKGMFKELRKKIKYGCRSTRILRLLIINGHKLSVW